ncbi:hypothetical protein ACTMTF_36545 [Nonomuraea sp. ZG12]|uniref:hypothetical protein n=1 Tax=Nonomuraea sp. ZG12 TaxID=3452207 RepID=UPI003F89A003
MSDPGAKAGPEVASGATSTTADTVAYKLSVPAGTTSKVSVRPGDIKLSLANVTGSVTTCTNSSPATDVLDVPIGTGGGTGTDIIAYTCTVVGGTTTDDAQVDIKVTPTMPTSARANQDASITWTGAVQSTGDPLPAPTAGFPTSSKLFATVKASGAGAPASATGEAALTATTQITTLPNVTIKVKPTTTGTVTITPGDLVFGTSATATTQAVKCTAPTTGLKTYTFTVSAATSTPTSSNTPTTSSTPTPTKTKTEFVTETPTTRKSPTTRSSQTPKKGAATGAGGDAGPDGRMFLLAGSVLVLGAGAGGLLLRRRNVARG